MKKQTTTRKFGGVFQNFQDKQERNHERKHLKAYLKGAQRFQDGKNSAGLPLYFPVISN